MWQFREFENIDRLVTMGVHSRVRHPMYAGFILWIFGWGICEGAPTSLAVGSLGVVSIVWWRFLEEKELESRYGATHIDYRVRTWF